MPPEETGILLTSSISIADVGKSPDIAQVHSKAHHSEEELNLLIPGLSGLSGRLHLSGLRLVDRHLVAGRRAQLGVGVGGGGGGGGDHHGHGRHPSYVAAHHLPLITAPA